MSTSGRLETTSRNVVALVGVAISLGCALPTDVEPPAADDLAAAVTVSFQDGVAPAASYAGTTDTYLADATPTTAFGTASTLIVDDDYPDGSGHHAVSLVRWDVGSIPAGSTVTAVSLVFDVTNASGDTYTLYAMDRGWSESQATWNLAASGQPWATAGARGASDRATTALGTVHATSVGSYTAVLDAAGLAAVQGWIDHPSTNAGLAIDPGSDLDGLRIATRESTTASTRPRLNITYSPPTTGTGLHADYFANATLTGSPTVSRTDATVGFDWAAGAPAASLPIDHFSARWTGTVVPRFSETYTFTTQSDDGVRLWINGVELVNNWTDHASTSNSGTIALTAGTHYAVRMEYFENAGSAVAKLAWSSPHETAATVPQSALYPASSGSDAGVDAGHDAAVDAARDAARDAAHDAGHDAGNGDPPGTWRSALFPAGWRPMHAGGSADAQGRFLPDFSYAGYHRGEQHPPVGAGTVVATVDSALGNGTTDATAGIQAAIDTACAHGGVVHLPAGTYRIRLPSDSAPAAIQIACSNVVLRGDGPTRTRILVDDARRLRGKKAILVQGGGSVLSGSNVHTLAASITRPTRTLSLTGSSGITPGSFIVVRNDVTDAFRADHRMDAATSGIADLWTRDFVGLIYPRLVTQVSGNTITLDQPVPYALETRDNARVYTVSGFVQNVGLESFSVGMVQNNTSPSRTEPGNDDDYDTAGTTGYEVHYSYALYLDRVRDGWVHDVDTYLPAGNTTGAHVLSHGLGLGRGAWRVSVDHCDMGPPEYRGGGGNGYAFDLYGSDNLLSDCSSVGARHGSVTNQAISGDVFLRMRYSHSRYASDSHRYLSQAHLYDNMTLDGTTLQSVDRGDTSLGAGFTGTEITFWNTYVQTNSTAYLQGCAVESGQWGYGYLIGSRAAAGSTARLCPSNFTDFRQNDQGAPTDYTEGEGQGATLYPTSLYEGQRALRCARDAIACDP